MIAMLAQHHHQHPTAEDNATNHSTSEVIWLYKEDADDDSVSSLDTTDSFEDDDEEEDYEEDLDQHSPKRRVSAPSALHQQTTPRPCRGTPTRSSGRCIRTLHMMKDHSRTQLLQNEVALHSRRRSSISMLGGDEEDANKEDSNHTPPSLRERRRSRGGCRTSPIDEKTCSSPEAPSTSLCAMLRTGRKLSHTDLHILAGEDDDELILASTTETAQAAVSAATAFLLHHSSGNGCDISVATPNSRWSQHNNSSGKASRTMKRPSRQKSREDFNPNPNNKTTTVRGGKKPTKTDTTTTPEDQDQNSQEKRNSFGSCSTTGTTVSTTTEPECLASPSLTPASTNTRSRRRFSNYASPKLNVADTTGLRRVRSREINSPIRPSLTRGGTPGSSSAHSLRSVRSMGSSAAPRLPPRLKSKESAMKKGVPRATTTGSTSLALY